MRTETYVLIISLAILGYGIAVGLGLGLSGDKDKDKNVYIPKNIFQTHKSQEFIDNNIQLKYLQTSWKINTEYNYHFYDNDACDKFMKEEFSDIYHVYNNLPLPVMKADMWRYCIIYKYGGIYADADTIHVKNYELDDIFNIDSYLVGVPENETHMCQWIFAAPKGSPILKSVIDLIVERSTEVVVDEEKKKYLQQHFIHYLTGPEVFTDGIDRWLKKNNLETYENKLKYISNYRNKNLFIHDYKFHKSTVSHAFSGQWEGGWFEDRKKYQDSIEQNKLLLTKST